MAVRIGSTGLLLFAEVAGIIGIVGCAAPRLRLDAPTEPPGTTFQGAFSRWTREGRVISIQDFDTNLIVSATLRSKAFQRAYTDRYLEMYRINDPAERTRIEQIEMAMPDSGLNFWVSTSSHFTNINDLTPAKGRWRVALLVPADQPGQPDSEVQPDEVAAVTRGESLETSLFGQPPDLYHRVWHLRFPALKPGSGVAGTSTPKKLTLRFAGPSGKTDLVWLVE